MNGKAKSMKNFHYNFFFLLIGCKKIRVDNSEDSKIEVYLYND